MFAIMTNEEEFNKGPLIDSESYALMRQTVMHNAQDIVNDFNREVVASANTLLGTRYHVDMQPEEAFLTITKVHVEMLAKGKEVIVLPLSSFHKLYKGAPLVNPYELLRWLNQHHICYAILQDGGTMGHGNYSAQIRHHVSADGKFRAGFEPDMPKTSWALTYQYHTADMSAYAEPDKPVKRKTPVIPRSKYASKQW